MRTDETFVIREAGLLCCMIGYISGVVSSHQPLPVKRETTKIYFIDLLVVADDALFEKWKKYVTETKHLTADCDTTEIVKTDLKEYLSQVVHQANVRLENLKQHLPFFVQANIVKFLTNKPILASVKERNLLTGEMEALAVLETFKDYLVNKDLSATYDHAVLFTGHGLSSKYEKTIGRSIGGRAYVGSMCKTDGTSSSVVHESGGFQSSLTVAHELSHSLGSIHDEEYPNSTCGSSDNYLMAAIGSTDGKPETRNHPWYFSSCSSKAIEQTVIKLQSTDTSDILTPNCLGQGQSLSAEEFWTTENLATGQIYGPNAQCQMIHGTKSHFCYQGKADDLSKICTMMTCKDPLFIPRGTYDYSCAEHFAAEGTSCGDKQWCRLGECVESDDAPVLGECPFGDAVTTNCDSVKANPDECYDPSISRDQCCETCKALKSDSEVCPYGDKSVDCTPDRCDEILPNGDVVAELCCASCEYNASRPCVDVVTIDGQTCESRVKRFGIQNCYNFTVAFHCCNTCSSLRGNVTGCEYGDRYLTSFCNKRKCSEEATRKLCCASCDGYVDKDNNGHPPQLSLSPICILVFLWLVFVVPKHNFLVGL